MRILITGSSGQIGTNLALTLMERGHYVFGIDCHPNPWTDSISTLLQDLSIPYQHSNNGIGYVTYPSNLDLVIHLAANAKVYELVETPERSLANIIMTFNVLEFCRHNNLPLIFSSSREVYGDIQRDITEESHADFVFTESPYSASKITGEVYIYSYAQCYGLRYLVFRFSNVYGRYDNDIERMERVVPLFILKISKNEPITVYGKDKLLDFTYIDDCVDGICRGIDLLISGRDASNHTINLAYGQGNTLIALASYIGECLGIAPEIIIKSSRPGEVTRYVADISKAKKLLGYNPTTPLDKGIPKTVAWCLDWWNKHTGGIGKRDS
jgi:UDP-glucose 4-epimerase